MSFSPSKLLGILAAALIGGGIFTPRATANVSLIFDFGGSSAISAAPGGSFSFDVFLAADPADILTAYDFYLQTSGIAGLDGYFTITGRNPNLSQFPELNSDNSEVISPALGSTLEPRNTASLGALIDLDPYTPVTGSSLYYLGSLSFQVSVAAIPTPSAFQIVSVSSPSGSGSGYWNNENFDDMPFFSGGNFSVTIVPEPSAAALIMLTGLLALRRGGLGSGRAS